MSHLAVWLATGMDPEQKTENKQFIITSIFFVFVMYMCAYVCPT